MNIKFEGVIKTQDIQYDENCGGIGYTSFNYLNKYRERVAMIKASTDEFCMYSEFLKKCIRTAIVLQKQGCKRQDLIAICSNKENFDANVPMIAGQFLGLITFSLDPTMSINDYSGLLEQMEPKLIFVIDEAKEMITKSLENNNAKTKIVCFGNNFEDEYLKPQKDEDCFKPVFIQNLQETCIIHFSSGSAGFPKPICLNHYYFLSLQHIMNYLYLPDTRKEQFAGKSLGQVSLRFSNWYWVSTSIELVLYLQMGGCRVLSDKFNAQELFSITEKYSITSIFVTPLHFIELSSANKPDEVSISSIKDVGSGGQSLPIDHINKLKKLLPGAHIYQMYGMTETGVTTVFNSNIPQHLELLAERPNSSGIPVPGYSYKVIDIKTGKKCSLNQSGELFLKGKSLFNGVYNKNTSKSLDDEGYFGTGDLVSFDDDFCIYFINRVKRIICYKDWQIYPNHVEKVILEHPSVQNALVVGIPHKIDGERLKGVVILKNNATAVTGQELAAYVNAQLEDHKRLREDILFIDNFPLTVTGKVNPIKTKEMVLEMLADLKTTATANF